MEIRGQRCSTSWTRTTSRISLLMCVLYPYEHLHGSFSKNQHWVDGVLSSIQQLHHHNFLHNISLIALLHLYPSLLIFLHLLLITTAMTAYKPQTHTAGLFKRVWMRCGIVPRLLVTPHDHKSAGMACDRLWALYMKITLTNSALQPVWKAQHQTWRSMSS